jgi:hypothetical protein
MDLSYTHRTSMKWDPEQFAFTGGTGNPEWLKGQYRGDLKLA